MRLQITWFNMPFLRSTLKRDRTYIFRGLVQEKNGRLVMDQPEIFTEASYEHKGKADAYLCPYSRTYQ